MHNKFIRLAVVALIAVGLAFWAGTSRRPGESLGTGEPVVPGLKDALNDVKLVRLVGAESKPIATLEKRDGAWVIAEKDGYPADFAKVREYLIKLADAKLVEAKTSLPDLYGKLGVEDIAGKDAKGVQLEIEGLKEPAKLIVGNYNGQGGDSTFVRRAGDAQSWLARGNLTADKIAANWLRRDLADVASSRIAEVTIASGGKTLRAFKNDAAEPNYAVADLPRGRELSSEYVANGLASVLSGLRFDDVVKAGTVTPAADAKVFDVDYVGFDGLKVTAQAWNAGGKDYANLNASLDEPRALAAIEKEQARAKSEYEAQKAEAEAKAKSDAAAKPADPANATADAAKAEEIAPALPEAPLAVTDAAKDKDERLAKLRKEVDDLNAKFNGWTYVLPNYKFANMNKTVDDLLKPKA